MKDYSNLHNHNVVNSQLSIFTIQTLAAKVECTLYKVDLCELNDLRQKERESEKER